MKRQFEKIFILLGLCFLLFASTLSRAAELEAGFEQANKLYELGKYGDAVRAYDKLLALGQASAALYFNRGNALFKQGQIGRAIASYRLARQMAPRDAELQSNLRFARIQARGGVSYHESPWQRWVEALTLNEWTLCAVSAFWLLLGMLAFKEWRPDLGRSLRPGMLATALALIGFGIGLAGSLNRNHFTVSAIVVTGEATVRGSPFEESAEAFKVRDGIELEVIDRQNDWLRVIDPAQRTGWVRADQTLIFGAATPGKAGS